MTIHTIDLNFLGTKGTIAAYLVEAKEGLMLVETGPYSTFPVLEQAMKDKGFDVKDIQHAFLTHIHLDHAGSAWALAENGAQVYVHPIGYPHMLDPSRLMSSAKRLYKEQMDYLWGRMEAIPAEQLHEVQHGDSIQIGDLEFKAWYTPGHATHHIAWQLGDTLFAGDVAGVLVGGGPVMPPCPPPDIDIEGWMTSIALMRSLELSNIYIAHFGRVTEIEKHLNELEFKLKDWSEWILPHFKANRDVKEVVPEFVAYVRGQLIDYGVSKEGLIQYDKANPAGLSVYGLMRYWKKKLEKS